MAKEQVKKAAPKAAIKEKKSGATVTIRQTASAAGRMKGQRETLIGLKLNKIGRVSTLEDTASIRGMIKKVQHLVKVES